MMQSAVQRLISWGPLFFGMGFLAPLISTLLRSAGAEPFFGFSSVQAGLVIGAAWGLYAKLRGSWI
jgi:hypothetical protein